MNSFSPILMLMDFSRDLILDLYHGRGAFEAVLSDEDVEEDPDRWCSYTPCGQERLASGLPVGVEPEAVDFRKTMQGAELRKIEWAPTKEAPPFLVAEENPPREYGPWQWAAAFGRATRRFGAEAFTSAARMESCGARRELVSG